MSTQPITCTWHEAEILDLTEAVMIADWRRALTMEPRPTHAGAYAQRAAFVTALIIAAVDYEPRFGMVMDVCDAHGCSNLVDENARTEHGLHCSDACRDDHAALLEQGRVERMQGWAA